jgi:Holliday junction resolvasome RuvABC endonuclease subunit
VLSLDALPPSDAADALALALTHLRQAPLAEALLKMKARQIQVRQQRLQRG